MKLANRIGAAVLAHCYGRHASHWLRWRLRLYDCLHR